MATPVGRWAMLWLYYRSDRMSVPATQLLCRPLGPRQGWAETPEDPAYNRPIRHPHGWPADRMFRGDPLYDICVVTDHNQSPICPGEGSAIFVHLWRRPRAPTAGCIAFRRSDLEWVLARWRPWSRIVVRSRGGL